MTNIIVPKQLTKAKNLVAVPHDTYKEFLVWQKKVKSKKTFKPTSSEKKVVEQGRKEIREGKYIKWHKLKNELANPRRKSSRKKS